MFTRVLTDRDAPAFYQIRRRALHDEREAFAMKPEEMSSLEVVTERFKGPWSGESAFVMGAFDSDLVGIVGCAREGHIKRRHAAVIWGVYVVPERRRHGVGRRLFLDAVARAREWPDLEQLWLDVTTINLPARTLYLSCGFQIIGLRRRALRIGDRYYDEEMMALDLR